MSVAMNTRWRVHGIPVRDRRQLAKQIEVKGSKNWRRTSFGHLGELASQTVEVNERCKESGGLDV